MKIIDFYASLLPSLGMAVKDDLLYYPDGEPVTFAYLKKTRQLCLPTDNMIKQGLEHEGKELHAFHPLCESMLTGESGTIRFLKTAIRMRLWQTAVDLVGAIIRQGAEQRPVKKSAYKQFLAKVCDGVKEPKFDDTLVASWAAVLEYISDPEKMDSKSRLRLVIGSNETIGTDKYARVARYANFTANESDDGSATYFGVRCRRKQDKAIIHRLLTTVFNWFPEETGSNDNRAYFGCLARAWANYVSEYNKVASALHDIYADVEVLDAGWISSIDSMEMFDKVIQTLPYNTGPAKDAADRSSLDYSVKNATIHDIVKPKTSTEVGAGETVNPMDLFNARKPAPLAGLLGSQIDPRQLTPAQRAEYDASRRISTGGAVKTTSLAVALKQELPMQAPSLMSSTGGLTSASILGGGQQTLGLGGQQTLGMGGQQSSLMQQTTLGFGNATLGQNNFTF